MDVSVLLSLNRDLGGGGSSSPEELWCRLSLVNLSDLSVLLPPPVVNKEDEDVVPSCVLFFFEEPPVSNCFTFKYTKTDKNRVEKHPKNVPLEWKRNNTTHEFTRTDLLQTTFLFLGRMPFRTLLPPSQCALVL